jgi:hypothetical protein
VRSTLNHGMLQVGISFTLVEKTHCWQIHRRVPALAVIFAGFEGHGTKTLSTLMLLGVRLRGVYWVASTIKRLPKVNVNLSQVIKLGLQTGAAVPSRQFGMTVIKSLSLTS